ncbi:hypothetical protein DM826_03060 [Halonotius aquaticus]|uniref:RmlD-like substrate binding domain-containing protein n=1 Tax=Halonotius aquaticus TaxID=2216978 RepID=A0A3A6PSJ1_9EURY|nr:hypothetical protein DM826_03060 [Halonotius aquaticus]
MQLGKTDSKRTAEVLTDVDPDIIVDSCESDRDKVCRCNAVGTRNVAGTVKSNNAHTMYPSTDYVFAGDQPEAPYTESDRIASVNYYRQAKYAAEQAAKITDDMTILRPSMIYHLASENFGTWALGDSNRITGSKSSMPKLRHSYIPQI